ncbi:MAG TPA: four helix bundle protein [Phycisphaerae bacterium]|jgi:four helix bundle protein|nr:four helix bundle protein [Phycisphaerae bacterium]HOB76667.1 four helix bundle protein [Phycisphaerae bacterium]HOJ54239.1 four helix bundle protein [Phycisphaerae bacterium]HOL28577.1 four helix bundle protein [Phycisphaerae bacterium]HPP20304.1 four helix bundle protein [Phycisphaerae bacterium]
MTNGDRSPRGRGAASEKTYDLEERTARFGEAIIAFAKKIPVNPVTEPLIGQLVRAGTSVGSNYCEADDAGSRKEFRYRISVCKRESRESKFWLRMIAAAVPALKNDARVHWREAKELNLIFVSIYRKTNSLARSERAE